MHAVVVREFGPIDSHTYEEVPDPVPGPGEVLIDTHVIGVNFPDTLMVRGLYQKRPDRPFTPGRDAAGYVAAVGAGVTRFKPGDRVSALVRWGAYAERVAAPEERCFHIPEGMPFDAAAALGSVHPTAHVSLMLCGHYRTGETVLVLGAAGGIGIASIQIAKAKGATVIAGDISEDKRQLALDNGADHAIDLAVDNLRDGLREQVYAVTDGRGVDVVIDPIGGDVFDAALRTLAFEGRIVSVGYVSGRIPELKINYLNIKNLSVAGVSLDQYFMNKPEMAVAAVKDVYDMYTGGQLAPELMATYPLEEFRTVMKLFGERKTKGKVLMSTGADA